MKCDELKALMCAHEPNVRPMYDKSEVDAAIAELKARIADLEKLNHDLCERVTENDDIRLHWEEIEQTRAENERLKSIREVHVEAIASMEAGLHQDDKEIRRLKRALYKACANWAMNARMVEIEAEPWGENHESRLWAGVYDKCLKKAEEYK